MKTFFSLFIFSIFAFTLSAQDHIPSTQLKTLDGKTIDVQDICQDDKTVVISLWATWCVPCINELNAINDIYSDMRQDVDFELVAISIDDARTVKSVKPLINGKNWSFDVYLDTNNDLKRKLGAITVPATYIVKNGKIIKKSSGYKPGYEKELWTYLKKISKEDVVVDQANSKHLYGSIESNTQYYLDDSELGIKEDSNRLANNSYLNVNYTFLKNFTAGIQLENYYPNPLKNYYKGYENAGIAQYFINYQSKKVDATVGHFYEQFGNGLILRSFEERSLGLNNALLGGKIKYTPSDIAHVTALYGRHRHGFETANSDIFGLNTEVNLAEVLKAKSINGLTIGVSYVGRHQPIDESDRREIKASIPTLVNAFSVRGNIDIGDFYTNIEYVYRGDDIVYHPRRAGLQRLFDGKKYDGNALQINTGFAKKGFAISATLRRLENMSFFARRNLVNPSENRFGMLRVNFVPSLAKQHDYALSNIYVYQAQPHLQIANFNGMAGEIGGKLDFYYTFPKETMIGGKYGTKINANYSYWSLLESTFDQSKGTYDAELLGFGKKLNRNISVEISKKWSEKWKSKLIYINSTIDKGIVNGSPFGLKEISYHVVGASSTVNLPHNKSLKMIVEHLWTQEDMKNWLGSTLEFNVNQHFSFYANTMYNYGNTKKKTNYYNFGGSYTVGGTRVALNYGRQRGGLMCTGGVCRYVSPNTGFTLNINHAF